MKNNKFARALLLVLCAILLVCASVMGTLAYLTANDEVTNTFTVGKVELEMDETDVDEHGVAIVGAARNKENTYQLIPGREYIKDPIVYVGADSETCYVFIKVQNDIAGLEAATDTIHDQIIESGWKQVETGVYYQKIAEDAADKELETFENFTIDINVNNQQLNALSTSTAVIVTAYAIQAENVEQDGKTELENAGIAWATVYGVYNTTP